jgi:hypothetical protein
MRRLVASICFFFALSASLSANAQTPAPSASPGPPDWIDPFCSVSVGLDYWDVVANAGIDDASSTHLASTTHLLGKLWAPGSSVAAHVMLFSDTDEYDVTIPSQPLSGDKYMRVSQQFIVALPKAMHVRYAYVDSYQLRGGSVVNCITEPHAFYKGIDSAAPLDIKALTTFVAGYKQALPAPICAKTYIHAIVVRWQQPRSFQTTKMLHAKIAVFLGPDGLPAKSYVYTTTGVRDADLLALEAANRSSYIAADFLCKPVASELLFPVDFRP